MECLHGMMGEDPAAILPAIEALSNLCLAPELQVQVVAAALERLPLALAEDLPPLVRFLLQHAAPGAQLKEVRGAAGWAGAGRDAGGCSASWAGLRWLASATPCP